MMDFAWSEFLVILIVAVIVIGPKQLPEVLYGLGRVARRLQYMKFALSKQFEDFMEQSDLNEIRKFNQNRYDTALHHGFEEEEQEEEKRLAALEKAVGQSHTHPDLSAHEEMGVEVIRKKDDKV